MHTAQAAIQDIATRQGRKGRSEERGPLRCFVYCRKSSETEERQVQSIERQQDELREAFGAASDIEIVAWFEEAQSAMKPGRPVFAEMLQRVEAGEADCLIAWAPDRLARNAIDAGQIVDLLNRGLLRDLKFRTYLFQNNASGRYMLNTMFCHSEYYSEALSENVRSGNRKKAALGWRPAALPLGYKHDRETRSVTADDFYFPLIRQLFDLALTGGYSARRIARIANDEWGLRSPAKWKRGGTPLRPGSVHRILTNPFYVGLFAVQGTIYRGRHPAMVSEDEFERVQRSIRARRTTRPVRHSFPLTGLIRCGTCGRAVTAEHKVNRHGAHYTYYHCARSGRDGCRERSIRAEALEDQVIAWLRKLPLPADAERRLRLVLERSVRGAAGGTPATAQALRQSLEQARSQVTELIVLRERRLIDDEEFCGRKDMLQREIVRLTRQLDGLARPAAETVIEPSLSGISFSNYAADCYERGDDELKRQIVQIACSNPTLTDKILSVEAAKWLSALQRTAGCLCKRASRGDVPTPDQKSQSKRVEASVSAFIDAIRAEPALGMRLKRIEARLREVDERGPVPKSPTSLTSDPRSDSCPTCQNWASRRDRRGA